MSYGCHNRPAYKAAVIVQDGWWMDGTCRMDKTTSKPFAILCECRGRSIR